MVVEKVLSSASSFFSFCISKHVFCCKCCYNPLKDHMASAGRHFYHVDSWEATAVRVLLNFMAQICDNQADGKNVQHY